MVKGVVGFYTQLDSEFVLNREVLDERCLKVCAAGQEVINFARKTAVARGAKRGSYTCGMRRSYDLTCRARNGRFEAACVEPLIKGSGATGLFPRVAGEHDAGTIAAAGDVRTAAHGQSNWDGWRRAAVVSNK